MSNKNRNRNSGGGEGNKITINAGISGQRGDCKISVVLRRGRLALSGETLQFRLGTTDNPHGPWIMDPADNAKRYQLKTDSEGENETIACDFSSADAKNYSQVLVVYRRVAEPGQGVYEQAVQLQASEITDGPKLTKKSGKRLKFEAPEGSLKSSDNKYHLPLLRTLNKDGKPSIEDVIFTSTEQVTLIDRSNGKPLTHNGKSARKTRYFVCKTPGTGLVLIDCLLEGTLECTLEIVHTESGETAAVKMEFEY